MSYASFNISLISACDIPYMSDSVLNALGGSPGLNLLPRKSCARCIASKRSDSSWDRFCCLSSEKNENMIQSVIYRPCIITEEQGKRSYLMGFHMTDQKYQRLQNGSKLPWELINNISKLVSIYWPKNKLRKKIDIVKLHLQLVKFKWKKKTKKTTLRF